METPETEHELCEQCGLCCRIFGPNISPTTTNLYVWIDQGQRDILRYFVAIMEDGRAVSCTGLFLEDLGNIAYVEMRNPDTGEYITACPFLRRVSRNRYVCSIHPVKPEMCCTYRPWIWGETYFNRCKAIRSTEEKCRWPV